MPFFNVLEAIKTKYSNHPIEAYEEAKESFNRRGPELVVKKLQEAADNLARAQEVVNRLNDENIQPELIQ